MKRFTTSILLLALTGSLALFSSCGSKDITFDLPVTVTGLTYGPQPGLTTFKDSSVIHSNLDSLLGVYGGSKDKISKIELKSLSLTITGPAGATFDPFYFADATLTAGSNSVKIAYTSGAVAAHGSTTADLSNQYSDLTSIVKEDPFTFVASFYDSTGVVARDTITANMVFSVSTTK